MYRNEHTNCGHLLRTRHDAHASSEGGRVLPDWERLAPSGCLSQYSRDHSGRKGSQFCNEQPNSLTNSQTHKQINSQTYKDHLFIGHV